MLEKFVKRGDIYYADLGQMQGSEQGGIRPVLVIQNDTGNKYSPTVICASITSQISKTKLPTHVFLESGRGGLMKDSVVMMEQIRTIDKIRLGEKIGQLSYTDMLKINMSIIISFGLSVFTGIFNFDNNSTGDKYESNHNNNRTPSLA